jgi:hypothetical protein
MKKKSHKQDRLPELPAVSVDVIDRAIAEGGRRLQTQDPLVAAFYESLRGVDDCGEVFLEFGEIMFRIGVQHGQMTRLGSKVSRLSPDRKQALETLVEIALQKQTDGAAAREAVTQ